LSLVPVGIEERRRAHRLEAPELVVAELELRGGEVVGQLFVGARADDDRGDARTREQPRERDLRRRRAAGVGDLDERRRRSSKSASSSRTGGSFQSVSCREPSGGPPVAAYLPVSRPPASGLQTRIPTPSSTAIGTSSYSASRACSV
jgi:hypothetical protein